MSARDEASAPLAGDSEAMATETDAALGHQTAARGNSLWKVVGAASLAAALVVTVVVAKHALGSTSEMVPKPEKLVSLAQAIDDTTCSEAEEQSNIIKTMVVVDSAECSRKCSEDDECKWALYRDTPTKPETTSTTPSPSPGTSHPGCVDEDMDANRVRVDSDGGWCNQHYKKDPTRCGSYDDTDFSSCDMCCACGGGFVPDTSPPYPSPSPSLSPSTNPSPSPSQKAAAVIITHGICSDSGFVSITSDSDCLAAAGQLGINAAVVHHSPNPNRPGGCYHKILADKLFFNSGSTSGATFDLRVLCRVQACQDTDAPTITDKIGIGCAGYGEGNVPHELWSCGTYDDTDFSANSMCCACGGGGRDVTQECLDNDMDSNGGGTYDSHGGVCARDYKNNPDLCGSDDDTDFSSWDMCCACGGGYLVPADDDQQAPPPLSTQPKSPALQHILPAHPLTEANTCVFGRTQMCSKKFEQGTLLLTKDTGSAPGGSNNTTGGSNSAVQKGMGCANWEQIMLASVSGVSLEQCEAKCDDDKQCQSYNYQADKCQPGNEGLAAKTCYLYKSQCVQEPNPCWDLGYKDGYGGLGQKYYRAGGTGCSNWADISLGLKKPSTWEECEKACNDNPECAYYNYQDTLNCKGEGFDDAHGCYLFKKTCKVEKNDCWTLNTKK